MLKVLSILIFLSAFSITQAQKRVYTSQRIQNDSPRIDGVLDDPAWDESEWTGDFTQREPYAAQPASELTQFKILYDDNTLYVAVRCFDTAPDSIVRRMSRRDGEEGDLVKIIIDSYHDLQTAFSFGVSAAGVKIDEAVTLSDNWDASWNPVWEVKTSIDNQGWIVEAAIPLTQLRFGNNKNHIWGLQVGRVLSRKEEITLWQYIPPNAAGFVHLMGELQGINNIQPKKQKEITPYAAAGVKTYQRDYDNPFTPGTDNIKNIGLDGKFGITNDLTLDFTVNPDFGQVEADPSEVNLTTFETKFDEKRPFFIEGKNMLSYRILRGGGPLSHDDLFYSRRIGRTPSYTPCISDNEYQKIPPNTSILGAAKLTGKTRNGWSVGIMESVTQKEVAEIDNYGERRFETAEPLTNYFASRIEKDLNNTNTQVSAMATATNRKFENSIIADHMHREAYTAGLDVMHHWKDKTYYVHVSTVMSHAKGTEAAIYKTQTNAPHYFQRPNTAHFNNDSSQTRLNGYGGTFQIGRAGNGNWMYTFWTTLRSPGLNLNDIGYIHRNDEMQQVAWARYSQFEPKGFYRSYFIDLNQWYATSLGGETRYYGGNLGAEMTFKNFTKVGTYITREGPAISTEILRGGPRLMYESIWFAGIYMNTDERRKFLFGAFPQFDSRDKQTMNRKMLELTFRYQFTDALQLSLKPAYTLYHNKSEWVQLPDSVNSKRYVMGDINQKTLSVTVRSSYNITPDFTIELYCMPFISAGEYSNYRYVNNPDAHKFNDRFIDYTQEQISYQPDNDIYLVDENIDGRNEMGFDNTNFNMYDFNSNMVVRWEFKPGSTVYLVWSQNRCKQHSSGVFSFKNDTRTLFNDTYPTDIFMMKFSYRFGI